MSFETRSVKGDGRYTAYRLAVSTPDAEGAGYFIEAHGLNMNGFTKALVQINPAAGANPIATVWYWNHGLGRYVKSYVAVNAVGVGQAQEFVVDCFGRRMFIELTGTLTGGVEIHVAGVNNGTL